MLTRLSLVSGPAGDSVVFFDGAALRVSLLPFDEVYEIALPQCGTRGLLVGNFSVYHAGGARVSCAASGLRCDLAFDAAPQGLGKPAAGAVTGTIISGGDAVLRLDGGCLSSVNITDVATSDTALLHEAGAAQYERHLCRATVHRGTASPRDSAVVWGDAEAAIADARWSDAATAVQTVRSNYQGGSVGEAALFEPRGEDGARWLPKGFRAAAWREGTDVVDYLVNGEFRTCTQEEAPESVKQSFTKFKALSRQASAADTAGLRTVTNSPAEAESSDVFAEPQQGLRGAKPAVPDRDAAAAGATQAKMGAQLAELSKQVQLLTYAVYALFGLVLALLFIK